MQADRQGHGSPVILGVDFKRRRRRPAGMSLFQIQILFLQFIDFPAHTPNIKGFLCQLWQSQNRYNGSANQRRIKNQSSNRYFKTPGDKFKIQRHTVLYGGYDNYQEKQKGDD
jgi:hypothetical protein